MLKAQWIKPIWAMLLVFLMSGCVYTLSEIRQMEPYFTASSSNQPRALSKCIELRARANTSGSFWGVNPTITFEDHPDHTYHIALTPPSHNWGLADVVVRASGGGAAIEYRAWSRWLGESEFLDIVKQCSNQL